MQTYLMVLGFDIWQLVVNGYVAPSTQRIDLVGKKASENNVKAMNAFLCCLFELEFVKVIHCDLTKEIWDNLKNIYEGDHKVKKAKLPTY